ncbi:MAG: heparan-alpha-glucosaminide N-acetyltransferase domain-containing protein [Bryobacteraceae bacterium]
MQKRSERFAFLDWSRGLAAVIMLQGHVFHSFTAQDLRESGPYVLSQFVGGMPPAIFLFLTGVTLAFMMDARERAGDTPWARTMRGLRRAGYLLALAYAFRLQLWVFALPKSPWTDLFRVDILNGMGLAVAVLSPMAIFTTVERIRLCAVLGAGIAAASPLVSAMAPGLAPASVRAWIVPDYFAFGFFPWASFVAFGVSLGSILRISDSAHRNRLMQWAAMIGFGLILGARYAAGLPHSIYARSDFWLDSPALIFIKLGVILLLLSFAFLWTEYGAGREVGWVRLLGTNSLFVYWVHTELVYGRVVWFWKENLGIAAATVCAVGVIVVMVVLTRWKIRVETRAGSLSQAGRRLAVAPLRTLGLA